MIIGSENLNTLANVTNLGFVGAILNYNEKNYEINKEILNISKKSFEFNKSTELYDMLKYIIELLEEIRNKMDEQRK